MSERYPQERGLFGITYIPNTSRLGVYLGSIEDYNQLLNNINGLVYYLYETRQLDINKMMEHYGNLLSPEQREFDWEAQYNELIGRHFEPNNIPDQEYYLLYEPLSVHTLMHLQSQRSKLYPRFNALSKYESNPQLYGHSTFTGLPLFTQEGLVTSVTLRNITGVNEELLGVEFMDFALHFWDTYTIEDPRGVTVGELAVGLYKIKSHKFEHEHEAVIGINNVSTRVSEAGVSLEIGISFSHD